MFESDLKIKNLNDRINCRTINNENLNSKLNYRDLNWMLIDVKYFLIMADFVNNLKNMVRRYPMCHLEFNVGLNLVI